jgi:hypothetical protein
MLKKIIILPLLFIISTIVHISCCNCPDIDNRHFYTVNNVKFKFIDTFFRDINLGQPFTRDSLYFSLTYQRNCVVKNTIPNPFLFNSAIACKCLGCGYKGLKNKLSTINITSNAAIYGTSPGNSLNSFFKFGVYGNTGRDKYYPAIEMVDSVNKFGDFIQKLVLVAKPNTPFTGNFTVDLKFENEQPIQAITPTITWQ